MKKVFITGISGFAGSHLLDFLKNNKELKIYGTVWGSEKIKNAQTFRLDLRDKEKVFALLNEINPDYVFHLAALTSPAASFSHPEETLVNNVSAQFSLLEALQKIKSQARVLIVGSGDEYGLVNPKDNPIKESQPLMPTSPYAVSKVTQDFLGLQYYLSYNLPIVRVRPFNHIGPRQSPHFVVSSFAKQIAEIESGKKEAVMKVGNLSAIRDFTDVEDMVKAYWLAVNKGVPGEVYNIGSGVARIMEGILNDLLSLSSKKIRISVDQSLMRPVDNPKLVCDFTKFQKLTGWVPVISFSETLQKILVFWREKIKEDL